MTLRVSKDVMDTDHSYKRYALTVLGVSVVSMFGTMAYFFICGYGYTASTIAYRNLYNMTDGCKMNSRCAYPEISCYVNSRYGLFVGCTVFGFVQTLMPIVVVVVVAGMIPMAALARTFVTKLRNWCGDRVDDGDVVESVGGFARGICGLAVFGFGSVMGYGYGNSYYLYGEVYNFSSGCVLGEECSRPKILCSGRGGVFTVLGCFAYGMINIVLAALVAAVLALVLGMTVFVSCFVGALCREYFEQCFVGVMERIIVWFRWTVEGVEYLRCIDSEGYM